MPTFDLPEIAGVPHLLIEEINDRLRRIRAAGGTTVIQSAGRGGGAGGHVIGWDIQDATAGLDVSDPVIPIVSGPIARCFIRVKVTDGSNDLEIDIRNNGVSIFDTKPLLPAGSNGRVVHEFATKANLSVLEHDDVVIDIVQGGAWEFAAYVPYEAQAE